MTLDKYINDLEKHLDYAKDDLENIRNEAVSWISNMSQTIQELQDEAEILREVNDNLAEENAELKQKVAEYELHTMELVAENTALKKHFQFST